VTISRRDLLRVFRRTDGEPEPEPASEKAVVEPPAAAFSLEAFYAARTPSALPPFAVKPPDAPAPTTRVGIGRTTGVDAAEPTDTATPIAPSLVPQVLPHRCLATTSFCSVCVERCPIEGAIVVTHGRPRVEPSRCDGCGRCVAACPAPILAFELRAREKAITP